MLDFIKGGVILIEIIWNCNYDSITNCLPVYSFRRFDTKESNTASGFNFRFELIPLFILSHLIPRIYLSIQGLRTVLLMTGSSTESCIKPTV
jgi:hypothetical protein